MFGNHTYEDPLVGALETGKSEYMVQTAEEHDAEELTEMMERISAAYELRQQVAAYERTLTEDRLESYGDLVTDAATGTVNTAGDVVRALVGKTGEAAEETAYQAGNVGEAVTDSAGRTGRGTVDAVGEVSEAGAENVYDTLVEVEEGRQRVDDIKAQRAS